MSTVALQCAEHQRLVAEREQNPRRLPSASTATFEEEEIGELSRRIYDYVWQRSATESRAWL